MSSIQKRTTALRKTIQHEWHERWWQFILDNPGKNWNWNRISKNPNITMKDINDNPDKPWNWRCIFRNQNITMEDINDNPDKPWNWYYISENPGITIKDINDNKNEKKLNNPKKYIDCLV